MDILRVLALGVLLVGTATTAASQPVGPPGERRGARGGPVGDLGNDELPDAELANMLDTYAIVQAQQALTISDEKYGTFAARLKKLQDIRRRNQRQRQQLVRELAKMAGRRTQTPADDTTVKNQLLALKEHDARAATELSQAYESLDEMLDVRQQAQFRIFEETIERRKLDLLVRARARALERQKQPER
jgi:hypothetical protein